MQKNGGEIYLRRLFANVSAMKWFRCRWLSLFAPFGRDADEDLEVDARHGVR